jgi:hypothetical protein
LKTDKLGCRYQGFKKLCLLWSPLWPWPTDPVSNYLYQCNIPLQHPHDQGNKAHSFDDLMCIDF